MGTDFLFFLEYLAVFSQLISFHDPKLFNHLDSNMFFPEVSHMTGHMIQISKLHDPGSGSHDIVMIQY